ncbi:NADP-dependent oxidoreductase [Aestuariivita boseongensis]|uniref:NADP-dependent oxidoreductase n=1 Tax=Aestuariivita boseongensis TaxID=1470562 RepID=UPI000680D466|nr:NADP-dependent oxidoreductase [Aestuariivita boseongensis]
MTDQMQRITLASRPTGAPTPENFKLESGPIPEPGEGEVLVRVHYMSLDPYMRGRMDDGPSYAQPVPLGGTMEGGAVGEVLASNAKGFEPGDMVMGPLGWATHAVASGKMLQKLDPTIAPIQTALGVLGMPGFTGWYGLTELGRPQKGETLVVAAATGPVGSMVGQLARLAGLRTVGIAGGTDKCAMATDTFGFDACLDHRAYDSAGDLRAALKEVCPDGIDIYFENVGGKVLEAVMPLMNVGGRIPVCGMISWYNAGGLGAGAGGEKDLLPRTWRMILVNRLSVNGFIISDHWDKLPSFLADVAPKVVSGEIAHIEDVAEGLAAAPEAFIGLLQGRNKGKQLVKLI